MAGFFQCFRPDGEGLAEAFEGVEGADEILPRLLEVYEVTADDWQRDGTYDACSVACDYNLQYHILWPLYRQATTIEEPFRPYFDLWKHGSGYRFAGKEAVRVYVPAGKLTP